MKIVKFQDGTYGIRRHNWWSWGQWEFKSLDNDSWYDNRYHINKYCKGSLEDVKSYLCEITDIGEVIK